MSDLAAYRALERRHTQALADWVESSPANTQRMIDHNGRASVHDYVSEYNYRFAIVACLASDLGHPEADQWHEDYYIFADLEEVLD